MTERHLLDTSNIISEDKPLNVRIHDLKEAMMVIDGFIRDMDAGYKFDDKFASAKSKLLIEVFSNVKNELLTLKKIYEQASR